MTLAHHIVRPSESRVVAIDNFIAVPRGSTVSAPPPLNWAAKDPRDVLDYQLDIAPAIVGDEGDSIATIDVSVAPIGAGHVTIEAVSADGTRAVIWLAAGQAATVYTVTVEVTTVNGRSLQRSILLPVMSLSTPAVPTNAILTLSGFMLTDQNGNPVLADT